jgi:hypothetical protein
MTRKELLKLNAISLVEHHKANCDDPACNISVNLVQELLALAGIDISKEEQHHFL